MTFERLRTDWLSRDTLFAILLTLPAWGIAGFFWALFMSFATDGQVIKWTIAGVLWAITCWLGTSVMFVFMLRGLTDRVPHVDPAHLSKCLAEVTKKTKYVVEQLNPFCYECRPGRGLGRHLGYYVLRVQLHQGGMDLTGPAVMVRRLEKRLQAP